MTTTSFFGNLLVAYGPALAVFFGYIARDAQDVILAMSGAFAWLIPAFITSLFWNFIPVLHETRVAIIFIGVVLQELFRVGFFLVIARAESGLDMISRNAQPSLNRPRYAFVTGFGFGMMSGAISYINQLAQSLGPGYIACTSCPGIDVYFASAITTCFFIALHTTWHQFLFQGLWTPSWPRIAALAWVTLSHMAASCSTLLIPSHVHLGCLIAYAVMLVILLINLSVVTRPILLHLKST
ncbi:hypothetical protein CXG81DRAFT_16691 [Caulochytrium protostelioides]|uniref:Aph-1 n=1 Tax=Caulochytrium protostelioides TaxID=1555241 RepID=A0A4P9X1K6_9FUNG|nr:Aph-1 [Caulochytrium protostelioides]RKP03858.1 hypothetical protein CXG81DRAFT_16691 [Caulochytrium protostelioides]|eukprot:RKP03858.1 hypothetical protein CXG81DRAFT_16691 [Caulochytrium protostelioides]